VRRLLQKVKTGVYSIPEFVAPDAADLIRRMLVVNPAKRITIEEVEQHPWFTKRPYNWKNGVNGPVYTPPSAQSLAPLDREVIEADFDILDNLQTLGYGTHFEIINALTSSEPNYEKVRRC
jgi:serine/threonine protein kinase